MSEVNRPKYASEVPFVPMNWGDRDVIVGHLMEILEAVMPEGKQLESTKGLVKRSLSDHFRHAFNNQYEVLRAIGPTKPAGHFGSIDLYYEAMWEAAQVPVQHPSEINTPLIANN